jgi:hypothetical protein
MELTVTIKDENGNAIVERKSERSVPYVEEIENQGFRSAFHDLESAILEARKEVCDGTVSEYLEAVS